LEGDLTSTTEVARDVHYGTPQIKVVKILYRRCEVKKVAGIIAMVALVMFVGCAKSESPQEKFQKKATAQIEEMQKKIDKLKEAYDANSAEMRKKFDEQMAAGKKHYDEAVADLKLKEAAVKKELADMKSATGEAWEKAKEKMDIMTDEMEKAYEKIKSQFKD
jgi:uncharacterized membrane-anchored protein YhcB (DUF1043 family)